MPPRAATATVSGTASPGSGAVREESGTLSVGSPREGDGARDDLALPARYVDLGAIASGSFGEVRRVRDTELDRVLAMKILHAEIAARPFLRRRFLAEVQITAQLQHPGIVPVYDHGELPDGRLWYVMKEVRGRTLGAILQELFAASTEDGFTTTASGWTFRRVADAFVRVVQTVAYAHSQGVVHRDLKPENVMVGEHGEVMVMDWGLSRRARPGAGEEEASREGELPVHEASAELTRHGDVLGTPAYMPPEQALGARDLHGPASDVYALGAILHHALTGRPPYSGGGVDVVRQILLGPPVSIEDSARGGPPVPPALARAAERAMNREIASRCSAEELAKDVLAWLDGARRREEALSVLEQARALGPEIASLRERADQARTDARGLLSALRPFDPVGSKRPAWAKEDESQRLGHEALLKETEWLQAMHSALRIDPELPEAHAALAEHYRAQVSEAEAQRHTGDVARFEVMLRTHDRGAHATFLRGEGALTLVTEPPGAEVLLHRYVESDRRLVEVFERSLGTTPLRELPLMRGSYLLRLKAEGRAEVRYPVLIERDRHWDGVAPGESEPTPIDLLAEGEIGPEECHVPAGWCSTGGDPVAPDSLSRKRIWIDAFVIGRHPVTNGEYLQFLNELVLAGREAEALAACPCVEMGVGEIGEKRPVFERDARGLFVLPSAGDDPVWGSRVPVVQIDWPAASAYAAWLARRTGKPFRLPNELEREKAARGADERLLAWGDHADATFACVLEGQRDAPVREPVDGHPTDESPYGVRGLTGNVRDWCINVWKYAGPATAMGRLLVDAASPGDPDFRAVRGGYWGSPLTSSRCAARFGSRPGLCRSSVGVRVVRSLRSGARTTAG